MCNLAKAFGEVDFDQMDFDQPTFDQTTFDQPTFDQTTSDYFNTDLTTPPPPPENPGEVSHWCKQGKSAPTPSASTPSEERTAAVPKTARKTRCKFPKHDVIDKAVSKVSSKAMSKAASKAWSSTVFKAPTRQRKSRAKPKKEPKFKLDELFPQYGPEQLEHIYQDKDAEHARNAQVHDDYTAAGRSAMTDDMDDDARAAMAKLYKESAGRVVQRIGSWNQGQNNTVSKWKAEIKDVEQQACIVAQRKQLADKDATIADLVATIARMRRPASACGRI